jgi:hypothetical protein
MGKTVLLAKGDIRKETFLGINVPYLRQAHPSSIVLEYMEAFDVTLAFIDGSAYAGPQNVAEAHLDMDCFTPFGDPTPYGYCHPLTHRLYLTVARSDVALGFDSGLAVGADILRLADDGNRLDWWPTIFQIRDDRVSADLEADILGKGAKRVFVDPKVAGDYVDLGRKKYSVQVREPHRFGSEFRVPKPFDTLAEIKAALTEMKWTHVESGSDSPWDTFEVNAFSLRAVEDLTLPYLLAADTLTKVYPRPVSSSFP